MTRTEFYEKWSRKLQYVSDWAPFAADIKAIKDEPVSNYLDEKCNEAQLTSTEREITRMLLRGWTALEIVASTGKTETTVKHHIASILHKFDARNRTELLRVFFPLTLEK